MLSYGVKPNDVKDLKINIFLQSFDLFLKTFNECHIKHMINVEKIKKIEASRAKRGKTLLDEQKAKQMSDNSAKSAKASGFSNNAGVFCTTKIKKNIQIFFHIPFLS